MPRVRVVCQQCATGLEREAPPRPAATTGLLPPLLTRCPKCRGVVLVDDPNLGHVVNGKWCLEERLGAGGMGTVYRAEDTSVGRPVAIKFLHAALLKDSEAVARFEQEARSMARIDHPNLVHLYAVERDGPVPCIVMKYVDGRRLSQVLREKKRLALPEVLALAVQIGGALSALHAQGFIHRDLKPGNVIVAPDGFATLLDFGLLRSMDTSLTRPGTILGTPHYMSPEQAAGSSALDGRSDLYALGVLTTELVCGQLPFAIEPTGDMIASRVTEDPRPPHLLHTSVPRPVSDVLMKAMARKPAERFPDVDAFLDALIDVAQVGPVGLPRRRAAEMKLVSGKAAAWPPVGPVLSIAQLEDLGLSQQDLSQVPDADVVSITDEDPVSLSPEEVTQAADFAAVRPLLDASQTTLPPVRAQREEDRTVPLVVPRHLTENQQTTPALKPVFARETTDPTGTPLPTDDLTRPPSAPRARSASRPTAPERGAPAADERTVAARASPAVGGPPRPMTLWAFVAVLALGVGAAIAWVVTR
ncbi:MAG: protein kinase [Myxococcaceae bacterium]|nr:protein kinase [Myxococcaceae bacterium]